MQNFIFWNPTKIVFGKGTIAEIGVHAAQHGQKALLVYGKASIKTNGIYDQVIGSLRQAGVGFVEFSGVKSNPILSHVNEGIALAKREQVDLVIAVGGGSVIDESKAIAAGVKTDGDIWECFLGRKEPHGALPVLTVLTIAATGSEMNFIAVLTNDATQQKFNLRSPHLFPKVSILDPTATYSVPKTYTAYGAVDAISHLIEGYFTSADADTPIQDRYVEGLIKSIMESAERILANPEDYEGRATMMWAATLALNGLPAAGIGATAFPNHLIGHSLGALYDLPHGATLSIVIPAWIRYAAALRPAKFAQFARRVFHFTSGGSDAEIAEKGRLALKAWFQKIGSPVSLAEVNIPASEIQRIAEHTQPLAQKWQIAHHYTTDVVAGILRFCAA